MKKELLLGIILCFVWANCFAADKYEVPDRASFDRYWYKKGAEISSYELSQHRYTEIRKGFVVNVFVTEPFDKVKFVKSDNPSKSTNAVKSLKLNQIKKFNTGIYQYSLMNSIFTPIAGTNLYPLKIASSVQEWCGHVFLQLNQKAQGYHVNGFSYFESEGDMNKILPLTLTEDGVWNRIRINPNKLILGESVMIPATSYLRLMHKELKGYQIKATLKQNEISSVYTITYPALKRILKITFENKFPFKIQSWEETYPGLKFMNNGAIVKTTAKLSKTIHSYYWTKNKNKDGYLRKTLNLDKLLKD